MRNLWVNWLPLSIHRFTKALDSTLADAFTFALVEYGFEPIRPEVHPAYILLGMQREGIAITCSIDRRDRAMFFNLSVDSESPKAQHIDLVSVLDNLGADVPPRLIFESFNRKGLHCATEIVYQVAKAIQSHGKSLLMADPHSIQVARRTLEQRRKSNGGMPSDVLHRKYSKE